MTVRVCAAALLFGALAVLPVQAAEVNLYTARHYDADTALYDLFTKETGIAVNAIAGNGDELMARLKMEGRNSPADVFVTVDAGNLWRAARDGLFQPVRSDTLNARIPADLRDPEGRWYGFSKRARVIYVARGGVDPALAQTYEDLARPELKGKVCVRPSSNIYNLSLLGAMIEAGGAAAAETWAKGVVANFARDPQGNDTDQLKALAAGECGVVVANTYYYVRLLKSQDAADREVAAKLQLIWPNQLGAGAHVNVSGAGVAAHAPNKDNAVRFLEFMASDEAQKIFAGANNEYPAVQGVDAANAELAGLGAFKAAPVAVAVYGENQSQAQQIFDRAGWK